MSRSAPRIAITVDDRPAITINQAAQRYGLRPDTMRKALERAGLQPITGARIERVPLYDAEQVAGMMASRPGSGAPGVPRPHRAPAEGDAASGNQTRRSRASETS